MIPPKKPSRPPTLIKIFANGEIARKAAQKFPSIAVGLAVAQCVIYTGLGSDMWFGFYAFTVAAIAFAFLWLRWDKNAMRLNDANVFLANLELTDSADLQWMAWVQWYEPRTAKLLFGKTQLTSHDMLAAMVFRIRCEVDAGYQAPYFGDTERCNDELEARRARERKAL